MSCPRQAAFVVILIAVSFYTRRVKSQRIWVMLASCILQFIALLVICLLPKRPGYKLVQCGMFFMTIAFSLFVSLGWSTSESTSDPGPVDPDLYPFLMSKDFYLLFPANVAGKAKLGVISAMT